MSRLRDVIAEARACTVCAPFLAHPPRPVFQLHPSARILVAGQAPGRRVHESGLPFDDPSGDRLREWMGIDRATFYDETRLAIVPMGFCFPGTGRAGDLPPRPECAPLWREKLLGGLKHLELTLVIGQYAHAYHLPETKGRSVTEIVAAWRDHWPRVVPLPHPSPRNNRWLRERPWFDRELVPEVRSRVQDILTD